MKKTTTLSEYMEEGTKANKIFFGGGGEEVEGRGKDFSSLRKSVVLSRGARSHLRTYRKTSFQRCHSALTDTRTNVWLFVGSGNKWQQGKRPLHKYTFLCSSLFLSSSFLSLLSALFYFVILF
jgi:hypothetical protein